MHLSHAMRPYFSCSLNPRVIEGLRYTSTTSTCFFSNSFAILAEFNIGSTKLNRTRASDVLPVNTNHKIIGYILDHGVRISTQAGLFSSPPRPNRLCCPASLLSSRFWGLFSLIVTQEYLYEADCLRPDDDEVQNERNLHPLPPLPPVYLHGMLLTRRDRFVCVVVPPSMIVCLWTAYCSFLLHVGVETDCRYVS